VVWINLHNHLVFLLEVSAPVTLGGKKTVTTCKCKFL